MILTCPNCATRYLVGEGQVPGSGREVRCGACAEQWTAFGPGPPEPDPAPAHPPSHAGVEEAVAPANATVEEAPPRPPGALAPLAGTAPTLFRPPPPPRRLVPAAWFAALGVAALVALAAALALQGGGGGAPTPQASGQSR